MPTIRRSLSVPVPAAQAWAVVADVHGYGRFTRSIHTRLLTKSGPHCRRQCSAAAGSWTETATDWQEGRGYTMTVDTQAPDYPFPLRAMSGRFEVLPEGTASRIQLTFRVQPKGLRGWLWVLQQVRKGESVDDILQGYAAELARHNTRT